MAKAKKSKSITKPKVKTGRARKPGAKSVLKTKPVLQPKSAGAKQTSKSKPIAAAGQRPAKAKRGLMSGRPASRPMAPVAARSGVKPRASNPLASYVDEAVGALALRVDPRWTPMIAVHLQVILQQAALVSAFTLPDDAEPAPVFKA